MRKRKKSEEGGFNVWRSYSDMMAGVLLLFILIMCVTLFQAQKSYNESIKERDDKIALQEQYTAEILAQQSELDEKNSKLYAEYKKLADAEQKVIFGGRLGEYKYYDMDAVIGAALECAEKVL